MVWTYGPYYFLAGFFSPGFSPPFAVWFVHIGLNIFYLGLFVYTVSLFSKMMFEGRLHWIGLIIIMGILIVQVPDIALVPFFVILIFVSNILAPDEGTDAQKYLKYGLAVLVLSIIALLYCRRDLHWHCSDLLPLSPPECCCARGKPLLCFMYCIVLGAGRAGY